MLEGFSLLVAIRTVTAGAASHGISFTEFVKRGMDPTSIAVMMEDGAACAGLIIAGQTYPNFPICSLLVQYQTILITVKQMHVVEANASGEFIRNCSSLRSSI